MKHFAKALISLVIALSVLATICIMGASVSAKTQEFVFVSETATKRVEDMSNTWESDTNEFSVVNTADLGGTAAKVPAATAYQVKVTPNTNPGQTRPGFKAELNGPSTDFSDFVDKPGQITIDMWIYVSDIKAVNNLILCFFTDEWYGVNYGTKNGNGHVSFTEYNFVSITNLQSHLINGWNHLQLDSGLAFRSEYSGNKVVGYSIHEHSGANADYTVAVASMKMMYDDKPVSSEADASSDDSSNGGIIVIPTKPSSSEEASSEALVSSEIVVSSETTVTSEEVSSMASETEDEGGSFPWWIIIVVVAAVAVAGVAVVLVIKKKKA